MRGIKQTRRTPTDINRIRGRVFCDARGKLNCRSQIQIPVSLHVTAKGAHVRSEPRGGNDPSMKITVRAFCLAERDLHVDAKAGHLHKNFNTAPVGCQAELAATRSQKALSAAKSKSFGDNFYLQISITRTVEFAKEDTLPATQQQLAVFHKYRLARDNQHGLHVRVRISFGVPVRPFKRNQAI